MSDDRDTISVGLKASDYGRKKETNAHRTKFRKQDKTEYCRICKKIAIMKFWYHGELIKLCKTHFNEWERFSAKIKKVNWTNGNGKPLKSGSREI